MLQGFRMMFPCDHPPQIIKNSKRFHKFCKSTQTADPSQRTKNRTMINDFIRRERKRLQMRKQFCRNVILTVTRMFIYVSCGVYAVNTVSFSLFLPKINIKIEFCVNILIYEWDKCFLLISGRFL